MPFFKTTYNILVEPNKDELYDANRYDSDHLMLPPSKDWDYSRELQIEDIDIWEVLAEGSGGVGIYAAWMPLAEFYMVTTGWQKNTENDRIIETYYGTGAQEKVYRKAAELGIPLSTYKTWVDQKDLWLYNSTTSTQNN